MIYSKIVSTGSYLPHKILSNHDLSQIMDTTDEWIQSRTGITQRHVVADDESSTDMCEKAALAALAASPYQAEDIDFIIVGTSTPEHLFPSNASQLQARLKCRNIAAMDISAACSGFIYALATADAYIKSGMAKRALVIGADVLTNNMDWNDRNTAVLFGDGAGAVIIEASEEAGIHGFSLHSDGSCCHLLLAEKGPGSPRNTLSQRSPYIQMQGREVFKVAVKSLSGLVVELLEQCQMQPQEIDFLVPHQANLRIISATAEHLQLPMEKVIVTVDKHANTSAASVPLALDYGIRSGKIQRGQKLLLEAFGGGFTWGGCILSY